MKSFKAFLFHRMRSTVILTVVLCIFAIILTSLMVNVRSYQLYDVVYDENGEQTKEEVFEYKVRVRNVGTVITVLSILCTVIPVLELGGLKNKRNADTVYALPIDRRKMCLAHFTNGFLQIMAVYICMAITTAVIILTSKVEGTVYVQYMVPLLLLPIPAALLIYAYFSFLFNEANSVVDGCAFIVSGILMPIFILAALDTIDVWINGYNFHSWIDEISDGISPYFSLTLILNTFTNAMEEGNVSGIYSEDSVIGITVAWCVICVLAATGYYFAFSRKRVESIGEISSSPIGYKAIIPLGMFCTALAIDIADNFLVLVIGAIAAVIGYMIYRRSFKIKLCDVVSIAGSIGVVIVIRVLENIINKGGGVNVAF